MATVLRRLAGQAQRTPSLTRGMADYHIPKADTSMDHVFGDSSFRLPFNFQPPSMAKTFGLTVVTLGVFGFPIWFEMYDDWKMQSFLTKLEEAKAKKAANS
mmetsp:Transcript_30630/g.78189  ORF Transcript_30630/g.78189 Transcript_30630/m.78189 type:complete len:101 (-) Transcript_30630:360-662(-)